MPVEVPCPNCGAKLKAPDNAAGKKVKCKKCDTQFRLPGPSRPGESVGDPQALSAIAMPAPPLPLDDDDVPMAGAVEPPPPAARPAARDVSSLPSADPFDFSAPPAIKPAAPKAPVSPPVAPKAPASPPPAPPAARPAFGAAKPGAPAAPARPAFGEGAQPKPVASPPPPPAPPKVVPPAPPPAAKSPPPPPPAKKPVPEPEPLPLDDEEPVAEQPPEPAPVPASADPFAFDLGGDEPKAEKAKGRSRDRDDQDDEDDRPRSRRKGRDRDDEDDEPRSRRSGRARDEDEDEPQEGRRYVRPGERAGGKSMLIAIVLGVAALGALVAAVVVLNKQSKEAEEAKAKKDEKKEEKKDDTGTPPPDGGKGGKADPKVDPKADPKTDPAPKKDPKVDPVPKKEPKVDPAPTGPALGLAPTVLPLKFQPAGAKLEVAEKPSGEALKIEAPPAKVKRVFAPADRRKTDVVVVSAGTPAGKGEWVNVDLYAPTGARVTRLSYEGDGKDPKCDLSTDGKFFAYADPDGKVTIWEFTAAAGNKTVLDKFDPYAEYPDRKKEGVAAVFFTAAPNRIVVVSTAGFAHLFDTGSKKKIEIYSPLGVLAPNKVVFGKNLAADDTRGSVVMAVNGVIYQIDTSNMTTAWKLEVGEVGRPLGLAVFGVPGRIAYAFETNDGGKKEKGVLFCLPKEKPVSHRWGETPGEPTGAAWAGGRFAVVPSDRGVAYFEVDAKRFEPVAFAELAGGRLVHAASENGHWYLAPDPAAPNRSLLLELTSDSISDFKNGLDEKNPPTVPLNAQGLSK